MRGTERLIRIWHEQGAAAVLRRGGHSIARRARAGYHWHLNRRATLAQLALTARTDKVGPGHTVYGRSYLDIYEPHLRPFRNRAINLLEIGIMTGLSLRLWKRYFSKASIYGLDIDPACRQYQQSRVTIEIGSQADLDLLERLCRRAVFDVVIDDGSHVNQHIIASFNYLFPRLRAGGVYIIEDLGCSYESTDPAFDVRNHPRWPPGMRYNDPSEDLTNHRADMDGFFQVLLSDLDHVRGIQSVHFWPELCIVTKAPTSMK